MLELRSAGKRPDEETKESSGARHSLPVVWQADEWVISNQTDSERCLTGALAPNGDTRPSGNIPHATERRLGDERANRAVGRVVALLAGPRVSGF